MKKLLFLFVLSVSFAYAEMKTFVHTIRQPFGGSQSADDARVSGVARAKQELLEEAGTYIESVTELKNTKMTRHEVVAVASGIVKTEILSQKNYIDGDAFGMELTVKCLIDTSTLQDKVKALMDNKSKLQELEALRKREKELLAKVAQLEELNRQAQTKEQKESLKNAFAENKNDLSASGYYAKAYAQWDNAKNAYTDSMAAIEYYSKAIELSPSYADAFYSRGIAFAQIKSYDKAIADYTEAIRLKPNYTNAYYNRSLVYYSLKEYGKSVADYTEAIRINPTFANAYYGRGLSYYYMGMYNKTIADCTETIKLDPQYTDAYYNRALSYYSLKIYDMALADYTSAIRTRPNYANAYYGRALAYYYLQIYDRSVADNSEAIRLNPSYVNAYRNRSLAYLALKQYAQAREDAVSACNMGDCDMLTYMNNNNLR